MIGPLDMEELDEGIPVPEVEPSVPEVVIVEIEDVPNNDLGDKIVDDHVDDGDESDEVKDLRHLNERADRLSKELKQLNIDANEAKCSKIWKKVQKMFLGFLVQKVGIFTQKTAKKWDFLIEEICKVHLDAESSKHKYYRNLVLSKLF